VTVQPSCVQTASTAMNAELLVRETRNGPATEFTSAAPPTSVSGDPAAVTFTVVPVNWPLRTARFVGVLLGPDGDDDEPSLLPHAVNSVASAAPALTWQAAAQKERRETVAFVSDIPSLLKRESGRQRGKFSSTRKYEEFRLRGCRRLPIS